MHSGRRLSRLVLLAAAVMLGMPGPRVAADQFDHDYATYAGVLRSHVVPPRVDYAALAAARGPLHRVVAALDSAGSRGEPAWSREQRMAFWINAYNAFTLQAIVDHYPIRAGWLTRQPRNSIRQIDGVWTTLKWRAAGRFVTLDDIEHRILRPEFLDARIHFAVNCASVSCPPLAAEPYRARTLDAQLNAAARTYLASAEGLQLRGRTIRVSTIFKWYGEDFIRDYAGLARVDATPKERAILGAVLKHGPPAAADLAGQGTAAIGYLEYDWTLNDKAR